MRIALFVGALALLVGCGGQDTRAQSQPPTVEDGRAMRGGPCPMMGEGAQVSVEDTPDGAALIFTTDRPEQVDELRNRVRKMAERHEQRAELRRERGAPVPDASVSVVDLPEGARLELSAQDPADVEALRAHASRRAERMQSCPMRAEEPA